LPFAIIALAIAESSGIAGNAGFLILPETKNFFSKKYFFTFMYQSKKVVTF